MDTDLNPIIGIIIIIIVIVFGINNIGNSSCRKIANSMAVPYQYSFQTGCMIKPKNQDYIPLENYKVNEVIVNESKRNNN